MRQEKHKHPDIKDRYDYKCVKRWAARSGVTDGNFFTFGNLFILYNIGNQHWTLFQVSFLHKVVVYYDSFKLQKAHMANDVLHYLKDHHHEVYGKPLPSSWKTILRPTGQEFT